MAEEKPAPLKAVPGDPERRHKYKDLLTRLIELHGRLRELVGSQRGAQWLVAAGMGLAMALAVVPHSWRLGAVPEVLGVTALSAVLLRVLFFAWYRRLGGARGPARDLILLASLVVMAVWLCRGYEVFASALVQGWGAGEHAQALAFGAPLAAGPLLVALLLTPQAGMLVALGGGFLSCLIWTDSAGLFAYYLVTGLVAAHYVQGGRNRLALIMAGLKSALPGLVVILGLALMRGWLLTADLLAALLAAGVGGLLSGVLAAGLAPVVEMAFGYTTSIRLMELASLDQPVLQELMLQAPGTYHHSLVVGSLVEAAAQEIGANHLLAKVAALYHDLGKLKKAAYFVENSAAGPSRHEKLAPSMSALVLTSHVKEGVEMARKHRLGQPIIDIIGQHHGTRVISFFYNKALESRRAAGQPEPDPQDFSYPGPRPQTREAGLVMLADTIEAASRTLDNPTPARLQGLVQQQINKIFAEGQLDECELTLKDLNKIAKSFNNILSGIFHQRVGYPQPVDKAEEKAARRDADSDRQPPNQPGPRPAGPAGAADTGLKRLGLR